MKAAILERLETGPQGTFGRIMTDGLTLFSGELPDHDNAPNISCIPPGKYKCLWTYSPAFKRFMYLVGPVDGRAGIRIHPGNLMGDKDKGYRCQLNGCIALGEKTGMISGQKAVLVSRPAVAKLENIMKRESFELEIRQ